MNSRLVIFLTLFISLSCSRCFKKEIPPECEIINGCGKETMCEIRCFTRSPPNCTCEEEPCCTLTQGGWENSKKGCKDHPIECNTTLCNRTYIEILEDNSVQGNAWLILAHQWIAAILNVIVNNVCTIELVNTTLYNANISLINNCDDQFVPVNSFTGIIMIEQAIVLDQFNNGNLGVEHCD